MKLIKLAVISFVFFFLLITAFSLLVPSRVTISKVVEITAPKEKLMEQLSDPVQWKNWYPNAANASLLVIDGVPKGIHSGRNTEQGLMITSVEPDAVKAKNVGPGAKDVSTGWNIMNAERSGTYTVQWYMEFRLKWYPWEKFSSLLFDKQYGSQMQTGLDNLKKQLETK